MNPPPAEPPPDAAALALTRYLHDHIPLTKAMGAEVAEAGRRIVLRAPLGPNVNHRETAFGGSVSSLLILAGWAWLHARLRTATAPPVRLVVQESHTHFDRPADGPLEAVCDPTDLEAFPRFHACLARHGRARITLETVLMCRGTTVARHTGRYVALRG